MLGKNTHFKIKVVNLLLIAAVIYVYNLNLSLWEARENLKVQEARADMAQQQWNELQDNLDELVKQYGNKPEELTQSVPKSQWKDGTYEGEGKGFAGNITVQVVIEDGVIKSIEISDYGNDDKAYVNMAKGLVGDILNTQSTNVDTVSGATFSSNGIISAVQAALEKAIDE